MNAGLLIENALAQGLLDADSLRQAQENESRWADFLMLTEFTHNTVQILEQRTRLLSRSGAVVIVRPSNDLNASVSRRDAKIVVCFDDSLLHLLFLSNLLFASTLNIGNNSDDALRKLFARTGQALFDEVLHWVSSGEYSEYKSIASFANDEHHVEICLSILDAQVSFLLFHELGHLNNGDLDRPASVHGADAVDAKRDSHYDEIAADGFAAEVLIRLSINDDDLTYALNAALPLFFGSIATANVIASSLFDQACELEWMYDERRLLSSHPDSERRLTHMHICLLDSITHEMISDLPDGRAEWATQEYRRMWNHGIQFSVNNIKAVLLGLVNVYDLFQTPVEFDEELLAKVELRSKLGGKVIY